MQRDIMKCMFMRQEALIFIRCDVWYKNAMHDCASIGTYSYVHYAHKRWGLKQAISLYALTGV